MPKVVATAAEMFNVQRTVACLSLALEKMTMEFKTMDAVINARTKNLKVFLNSGFFIDDRRLDYRVSLYNFCSYYLYHLLKEISVFEKQIQKRDVYLDLLNDCFLMRRLFILLWDMDIIK